MSSSDSGLYKAGLSMFRHRRVLFLVSILLRVYFALSMSYIHPDEFFQGPEALSDRIFGWSVKRTWEFESEAPIRSYFTLWFIYGIPMTMFELLLGSESTVVSPVSVYYCLRLMFALASWVLIDMAIDRLSPRYMASREKNLLFVATSYVSWTYQSHFFSNSFETTIVLWYMVIIAEIDGATILGKHFDSALLGCLTTVGVFNRITFPAWIIVPFVSFAKQFCRNPSIFVTFALAAIITAFAAISVDTFMYGPPKQPLFGIFNYVVTPLNNLLYNSNVGNLSLHGLHMPLHHWLINVPELLGPGVVFLLSKRYLRTMQFMTAAVGITILSIIPHQEARFILPAIPLLCSCFDINLFKSRKLLNVLLTFWCAFNLIMGFLMGVYHQGGVVSAQSQFVTNAALADAETQVWWNTYSPPISLLGRPLGSVELITPDPSTNDDTVRFLPVSEALSDHQSGSNGKALRVVDLMGASEPVFEQMMSLSLNSSENVYLICPYSSIKLSPEIARHFKMTKIWSTSRHLSLDLIDWSNLASLTPGLDIWKVEPRSPDRS